MFEISRGLTPEGPPPTLKASIGSPTLLTTNVCPQNLGTHLGSGRPGF